MNIYFIRHGEGYHNLKKNGQSQHHLLYPTLTAKGISQCVRTCNNLKHVHFDLVIVSPLIRTIQTFDYIFFLHVIIKCCIDRLISRNHS